MENYEVVETSDGKSALLYLEENKVIPQLIIMDLNFPLMTAEEFVQALRSRPDWVKIPLLVISGQMDTENYSKKIAANGFLMKPFEVDSFISKVKELASNLMVK